jgi:hypothetical protein
LFDGEIHEHTEPYAHTTQRGYPRNDQRIQACVDGQQQSREHCKRACPDNRPSYPPLFDGGIVRILQLPDDIPKDFFLETGIRTLHKAYGTP